MKDKSTYMLPEDLREYLKDRYTDQTRLSYEYALERWMQRHTKVEGLSLSTIETYMAELKQKGQTVGYRTVTLSAIKAYYDYALEKGLIHNHPCKSLYLSEKKPTGKVFSQLLTIEEMERLFDHLPRRYSATIYRNKVILGLLIYQGITSQELCALRIDHVDLDQGVITIPRAGRNKGRSIALKPSQIAPMIYYLSKERPELYKTGTKKLLLTMRAGELSVDTVHSLISRMQGGFDKPINPKNIRQSVISYWLNDRKLSLEDVQVMAGHRYPSSTQAYIRQDTIKQRDVVNQLFDQVFG